jgi:polygalacturonase
MRGFRSLATLLAVAAPALLRGQDTRTVVEPKIPPACTTLSAALVPVGDTTLAEADEQRLDTDRIQGAIDGCAVGKAVVLRGGGTRRAFLSGALRLKAGVTLVVDSGAILFGSRDPKAYEVSPGSCGVLAKSGRGCRALIAVERASHAGVMGPGTIDGRGWATLLGRDVSWWDLAQQARTGPLTQNCPRLIQTLNSDDFTLYRVAIRNSPNFHVVFDRGDGFTAWGVVINTPQKNARNTDGIDPAGARNVTITHSSILAGDDNVAIKGGSAPTTNVTISHNRFYRGHGMSIGSETNAGVSNVLVTDLIVDGADNALRIKSNASRGGRVINVTYENVCVRKTKEIILMDTHYSASPETTGTLIPVFRDVVLRNVRFIDGGKVTLDGYDADRTLGITFDNVFFDDPAAVKLVARHTDVTVGPGAMNLAISGEGVRVTGTPGKGAPNACEGRFLPALTDPVAAYAAGTTFPPTTTPSHRAAHSARNAANASSSRP